ncbi:tetratricopeptide repeat protein [Massilia sp. PWRC2]|uniref:tetratricopeptide repeat protein n=1 Tax=Massilia sp. PWRC2 TaxID=2804626 RepID=UPI003CEF0627
MKTLVLCVALLCAGAATADELADADALFAKKSYPQALQLYTRLATAGNVVAQRHLGEMYWYGEAGAVSDDKAQGWFRRAAASGDKEAAAALEVMRQRVLRQTDIAFWTDRYDGEELRSGKFKCSAPRIPAISKDNPDIDAVLARVKLWQDCYNGLVGKLNGATFASEVPADLGKLMKQEEIDKVNARLEKIHTRLAEDARISSQIILADIAAWRSATDSWVKEHNDIIKSAPTADRQADIEARKRNYAPK